MLVDESRCETVACLRWRTRGGGVWVQFRGVHRRNPSFFFQAEDGIRDHCVTGVQTCALPISEEVFEVTGKNPLLDIATELERIALEDDYFISRKLYPNVDFYSGLIYEALGMPVEMFPVLFAIGRTSGWIAQWLEMIDDSEQKIARPRQIYTGERGRDYVPIDQRG